MADLPNFHVDAFYIITLEASDNSLKRYLQKEDVITEDVDPDGSFVVPDEYQFRRLLNLVSLCKGARGSSLMIASAIINLCDSNFGLDIEAIAGHLNLQVERRNLDDFVGVMRIETTRHNEIENLHNLNVAHYVLAASMLINLIGKNVNITNYSEWKQRRIWSYSAPLMLQLMIPTLYVWFLLYNSGCVSTRK